GELHAVRVLGVEEAAVVTDQEDDRGGPHETEEHEQTYLDFPRYHHDHSNLAPKVACHHHFLQMPGLAEVRRLPTSHPIESVDSRLEQGLDVLVLRRAALDEVRNPRIARRSKLVRRALVDDPASVDHRDVIADQERA